MEIIYWSDYACPFCFIGRKHLELPIEKINKKKIETFTVTMKAFELDPSAPTVSGKGLLLSVLHQNTV